MTNKLFGVLFAANNVVIHEVNEPLGVRTVVEVEVNTLTKVLLLHVNNFLSSVVLQNELFKEQEGSLVLYILSDLHLTMPQVRGIGFLARIALKVLDYKFDNENLLQKSSTEDVLLNGQLDLESLGVSLSPDEVGVNKLHTLQTLDVLHAVRQQLRRLRVEVGPRWSKVPVALFAMLKLNDSGDTLGDINTGLEAVDASVAINWVHQHSAKTASDLVGPHSFGLDVCVVVPCLLHTGADIGDVAAG